MSDESTKGQTDESGKTQSDLKELQGKILDLTNELAKAAKVKEKIVTEQNKKNEKFSLLKEEKSGLQNQFLGLQQSHTDLLSKFENISSEYEKAKTFREKQELKQQAELDRLVLSIPEEKKSLLPSFLGAEEQLNYIKQNYKFLLGSQATPDELFKVPSQDIRKPSKVALTDAEKSLLGPNLSEQTAIMLKSRNPKYFENFLKK